METAEAKIRDVRSRVARQFLERPGVVGVGIERGASPGSYRLAVYLDSADAGIGLPHVIDGFRVAYHVSGPLEEQNRAFG